MRITADPHETHQREREDYIKGRGRIHQRERTGVKYPSLDELNEQK